MDKREGIVFHIIRGSFVDGYGIRTTVFLKGCPLRCLWCCNPEGQLKQLQIKYTPSACNSCGRCAEVCPYNAIQIGPDKRALLNRELCTDCGQCIDVCFTGALSFFGKVMTVDEVWDIVKQDERYYRSSGGGVTIGGGEPTFQPYFTYALMKRCQENHIHVALDTCGYVDSKPVLRCLEEADLLLFDLKGLDEARHRDNTGVSNELILKNLIRLDAMGKAIIIRLPLIPGYTDSEINIEATAKLISGLKSVERVDLLAYHLYGSTKYEQLGMPDRLRMLNIQPLGGERLAAVMDVFCRYDIKVQIGG